jgi:hypothetical protein
MVRGFIASGTSRASSTLNMPFSSFAPTTLMKVGQLEPALESATGYAPIQIPALLAVLHLAGHNQHVGVGRDGEFVFAKAGYGHGQAISIVTGFLDVLGRIAARIGALQCGDRDNRSRWWNGREGKGRIASLPHSPMSNMVNPARRPGPTISHAFGPTFAAPIALRLRSRKPGFSVKTTDVEISQVA